MTNDDHYRPKFIPDGDFAMALFDLRRSLFALGVQDITRFSDNDVMRLAEARYRRGGLYVPSTSRHDRHSTPAARRATKPTAKGKRSSTPPEEWRLGHLSAKNESGTRGSRAVSPGIGDAGGVSYGTYQMTSVTTGKNHTKHVGGTVQQFVTSSSFPWSDQFAHLTPGSDDFSAKWKELAESHPAAFFAAEHQFIKQTHYDPLVAKVMKECNLAIGQRSHALQDVVWSTAVQHGSKTSIIGTAVKGLNLPKGALHLNLDYDKDIIIAIYAERGRVDKDGNLEHFKKNSKKVQEGVASRYKKEQEDALAEFDKLK